MNYTLLVDTDIIRQILLFIPPLIFSLSVHEWAHAWSANKLGDATARHMGRMTLDPMVHVSLVGTIVFPIMAIAIGGPFFGWANPVPVEMRNFKKPRPHMALVAAAGPASNLILAVFFTGVLVLGFGGPGALFPTTASTDGMAGAARQMVELTIILNLFLCFFNLIPLPPLDGSRIVQGFASPRFADWLDSQAFNSQILLIVLLLGGAFRFLAVIVEAVYRALLLAFSLIS